MPDVAAPVPAEIIDQVERQEKFTDEELGRFKAVYPTAREVKSPEGQ
jgi:hypothetical protein